MSGKLLAGWSGADITPRLPAALLGQYEQRIARKVGSRLQAVVLAVGREGDTPVYWAACDLLFTPKSLKDAVVDALKSRLPDADAAYVILSATHIHTGPYMQRDAESSLIRYLCDDPTLTQPEENRAAAASAIADAIVRAHDAMVPSTFSRAASPIQTGYCRRVTYTDGSAAMYGRVDRDDFKCMEYHDGGLVNLLYVRNAAGKLTGVVANVPCTAQVVEHKDYITSDYWGYTRAMAEASLGDVRVLGVTGCAGDLSPRDQLTMLPGEPDMNSEDGARWLGERIAREILRYADAPMETLPEDAAFVNRYREVDLPRWNPTFAQYTAAKAAMAGYAEKYGTRPDRYPFKSGVPSFGYSEDEVIVRRFEDDVEYVKAPVHALRIGNVAFITNPFECFIEYADRVRAGMPGVQVFDVQLTDDAMGYLATRRAVRGGGYSAMIFNGQCGPDGGDVLVRESLALLKETEEVR